MFDVSVSHCRILDIFKVIIQHDQRLTIVPRVEYEKLWAFVQDADSNDEDSPRFGELEQLLVCLIH